MNPSEKHDVDIDVKSARSLCKRKWTLSGLSSGDFGYSLTAKWLFGSEDCYVELREGGVYVDYYGKAQIWRPREKSKFEVVAFGTGFVTLQEVRFDNGQEDELHFWFTIPPEDDWLEKCIDMANKGGWPS